MKGSVLFIIAFLISFYLYSQRSVKDFELYMNTHLPAGWKQHKSGDSSFIYFKKGIAQQDMDPPPNPPEAYGFEDSLCVYLRFFKTRNKWQVERDDSVRSLYNRQMEQLYNARRDSIYSGKKGFYKWRGDYIKLKIEYDPRDYITIPGYEITLTEAEGILTMIYFFDETIYDEAKKVRQTILDYLNGK